MSKNLVIVESPAKAKTIEGYLGKDFVVRSSFGHVRELTKKGLDVDVNNNFVPTYQVSEDKQKVVAELRKLTKTAEMVWLATDEDREGEAISWHLYETLNLNDAQTKRIVFHEITKPAILKAIENPRKIDINLVNAQQARRVLDRLVGFELSPILWRKVRPSLSAGRVQSVAVRLIVERERDIMNFKSATYFRVNAIFSSNGAKIKSELNKKFDTRDEALSFINNCVNAKYGVESLETKPSKKTPAAPFTTSTLQQEAARKLGFSVAQTMAVAQRLYEAGKITYMRTDSVNLSETALNMAQAQITKAYGPEFHKLRKFNTKSKSAQEAHEAIRPTYMENQTIDGERNEIRLYDLIWKRTLASQMADAELEKTTAIINISSRSEKFIAQGEVLKFEGFLKVYLEGKDDEEEDDEKETDEGMLPPMTVGQALQSNEILATQRFTHHPARYTEASLVKKLEELGIGRPSTYAPTISTVQKRGYVEKTDKEGRARQFDVIRLVQNKVSEEVKTENTGAEKSKLFPTDIGMVVNDFLLLHFPEILDFNFTAKVEEEFDIIANGKMDWQKMLKDFYKPFHKSVEKTLETSERANGEKLLGIDAISKKNVYARIGRYGPMVQIGESTDEEKPRYAALRKNQRMETITLDEAMELFKLPRILGEYEGKEMKVNIGRFGPYILHNNAFVSIGKLDDPFEIEAARAIELIENKRQSDREKLLRVFSENERVQILKGRWGPYLTIGKTIFRIPKTADVDTLSYDECLKIANVDATRVEALIEAGDKKKAPAKKATARKKAASSEAPVKKASAKKTVKRATKKATSKKAAPKKAAAKKAATKKAVAKK
jgi:DNA topoisomerase I